MFAAVCVTELPQTLRRVGKACEELRTVCLLRSHQDGYLTGTSVEASSSFLLPLLREPPQGLDCYPSFQDSLQMQIARPAPRETLKGDRK